MKYFQNCRILVVGGAGFVGSNLVSELLKETPEKVIIVDNLLSSEQGNIQENSKIKFLKGSITDEKILEQIQDNFDYCFHLATYHGNQNSICRPIEDHENNTLTSLMLFQHVHGFRSLKKIVYSSAGCTVAEKSKDLAIPTTEDSPISLYHDSPYQISKIIGEFYGNYYYSQYKMPFVKARFQNVYGPREILGAGVWRGTTATIWRNVIPTFIYQALKGMDLVIDGDGKATRDFIYVEDIVKGLLLCAAEGKPGGVYNLASGKETTIADLAKLIVELTGGNSGIRFVPKREWDNSERRFGSTLKSRKEIGFSVGVEMREGINKTIAWMEDNMAFIDTCIQKHKLNI